MEDLVPTLVNHLDTGGFIVLTWYLITKWIPAERLCERVERERLIDEFTKALDKERELYASHIKSQQDRYDAMVLSERNHFKDTVKNMTETFIREIERIESKI